MGLQVAQIKKNPKKSNHCDKEVLSIQNIKALNKIQNNMEETKSLADATIYLTIWKINIEMNFTCLNTYEIFSAFHPLLICSLRIRILWRCSGGRSAISSSVSCNTCMMRAA